MVYVKDFRLGVVEDCGYGFCIEMGVERIKDSFSYGNGEVYFIYGWYVWGQDGYLNIYLLFVLEYKKKEKEEIK